MVFAINEINQNATLLPNLTLGFGIYDTCGAVHRGIEGALWMMSGQEVLVPGYRCLPGTPLAAIIGDAGSRISLAIARILGLYSYPLISYFATVPQLSDRRQFPSFFRTIPSDVFQVQGLVRLIQHFGWSWLGLLASEDDYGQMGSQILQKELLQSGACLAFHETVPLLYDKRKIQRIVQVVKSSSAKAIIVFTFESFLMPVVVEMARQNVTGKVWVATEGWSTSHNLANRELLETMEGTIGFAIRRADIPGLREHLLSVSPNSPTGSTNQTEENKSLVKLFWEEMFKCKWPDIQDNLGGSQQLCTGQENLSQLGMATTYSDVSNLRISYNIYNAVYAAAHALHDLHSCKPGEGPFANGGCANIRDFEPWQLLHYIKKVRFNNNAKEEVHFDENGISPTRYDILNWQKTPTGDIQYVKIGSFDYSAPSGRDLEINESAIIWNGGQTQAPVSVCSESCPPGSRKAALRGQPVCCFDCIPCSEGEIANHTDSTECLHCPEGSWSNKQRDSCIPKVVEFLSYTEPLGAVLASLSVLTSLLPASTLALFLWHHHTPIVKANNRQLSYVLLCALALCPLCSLIFIGQPSPASCMLRQTAFGIIFALSVSCVLAKTVLVVIAFKASIPGSSLHRWVGTRLPNSIACLGTLIQVGICGTWLGAAPPFPENNIKSQIGKVILECNEGSALAFWCMLGYMGILASVSFVVAFLSRNLPDSFNEAKFITFSMLVFVSVWLSFIPAYLSTKGKYMVSVEIFAILSSSAGLQGCIFFPKCYIILLRPERNTRDYLMGKGPTR
ncbi:extracellular calcium-sensing receptor-like [Acipenser ruthenus]|uniref:extracellular calcium-sensing receptor-like n=1 Tax=Acipenser ruthenus TaxID=7906 RepID=UPI0027419ACF|nr:extracellular calcium-sensing receptor-like [Acipenser ruthenus]